MKVELTWSHYGEPVAMELAQVLDKMLGPYVDTKWQWDTKREVGAAKRTDETLSIEVSSLNSSKIRDWQKVVKNQTAKKVTIKIDEQGTLEFACNLFATMCMVNGK